MNLNQFKTPASDTNPLGRETVSARSNDGSIRVYFDDLEATLCQEIVHADAVIGCVAWLTSDKILQALAQKEIVSVVVQKEDFLRPDLGAKKNFTQHIRSLYDRLPRGIVYTDNIHDRLNTLNVCGAYSTDAVRCVGNHNRDKSPAFPRSHHKFVILCKVDIDNEYFSSTFVPYAVWTGSFNFTYNATQSLENALVITDPAIVQAYVDEFAFIFSLSETLDWRDEWSAPEFRIGT